LSRHPDGRGRRRSQIAISSIVALEDVQVKLPLGVRIRVNLDRATEEMFCRPAERGRSGASPAR